MPWIIMNNICQSSNAIDYLYQQILLQLFDRFQKDRQSYCWEDGGRSGQLIKYILMVVLTQQQKRR
jgi:hypothetical protein